MENLPFLLLFGITALALFFAGYLGKIIKVPILLMYILVGILLARLIHFNSEIKILGEIGIVILFFFLGLEFNITKVIQIAKRVWIAGLIDFLFNFILIFVILLLVGFDFLLSFGIAGISYASSSAITTKMIIDEHRIANTETEFILGLMVFEDLLAPFIVAFSAAFFLGNSINFTMSIWILLKLILVVGSSIFIAVLIRKFLSDFIDKYFRDEILTLMIMGFVIMISGFTKYLGLSEALGAFLVGIIVSESGKSYQVESLIIPIRDITVSYFFLVFGSSVVFTFTSNLPLIWILIPIAFIAVSGKIFTGIIGGKIYGLSKRKSAIAGLSIVNRGEFSIAISQYLSLALAPLATLYIFILAFVGIVLSQFSANISNIFYKKKKSRN